MGFKKQMLGKFVSETPANIDKESGKKKDRINKKKVFQKGVDDKKQRKKMKLKREDKRKTRKIKQNRKKKRILKTSLLGEQNRKNFQNCRKFGAFLQNKRTKTQRNKKTPKHPKRRTFLEIFCFLILYFYFCKVVFVEKPFFEAMFHIRTVAERKPGVEMSQKIRF